MATGKKGHRVAERVENLDFDSLRDSQVWTMSDWMQCRHAIQSIKSTSGRRAKLREVCMANLQRAQQGYDVIVLGKMTAPALPADVEKRMYEVLTSIIDSHKDAMGETAFAVVAKAADSIKDTLSKFAKDAVKHAAESTKPIVIKEKGKTRKVKGVLPAEFKRIVELGAARKNIMMVGPAGCGKTYIAAKLAEALQLPFADQSCSAGLSESAFTGWLLPVGKAGQFEYVESPFIHIYENGGVFLLDEIDAADANLLTFLNKAIANDSFHLPQRFKNTLVKKHKDCVIIAAANTYGHGADAMYVGRNQLDAATLDRFRAGMVVMDYSQTVEEELGTPSLLEWAWAVRKGIREKSLRRIMSTRVIKDFAEMTEVASWKREDWEQSYFADWSEEERALLLPYMPAKTSGGTVKDENGDVFGEVA